MLPRACLLSSAHSGLPSTCPLTRWSSYGRSPAPTRSGGRTSGPPWGSVSPSLPGSRTVHLQTRAPEPGTWGTWRRQRAGRGMWRTKEPGLSLPKAQDLNPIGPWRQRIPILMSPWEEAAPIPISLWEAETQFPLALVSMSVSGVNTLTSCPQEIRQFH